MEKWKDIIELDNDYQISNLGRVKSKQRIVEYPYQNTFRKRVIKEKILTPKINKTGNRIDSEQYSIRKKCYLTSHLVYKYFIDENEISKGFCIAHKDKNCLNNRVENLIKVTWSESKIIDNKKSDLVIKAQLNRSKKGAKAMKTKAFIKRLKWLKPNCVAKERGQKNI